MTQAAEFIQKWNARPHDKTYATLRFARQFVDAFAVLEREGTQRIGASDSYIVFPDASRVLIRGRGAAQIMKEV